MILEKTMLRTAKVDLASVMLIAGLAAFVPACGAPPVGDEDIDAADEAQLSEHAEAIVAGPTRGRGCEVVLCRSGYVCEEQNGRAVCVPASPPPACQTDADCSLVANYCGGCNCLAVGPGQSVPKCHDDVVACLQWPCQGYTASCYKGMCVASQGALQ
jgi:hypothetical protein